MSSSLEVLLIRSGCDELVSEQILKKKYLGKKNDRNVQVLLSGELGTSHEMEYRHVETPHLHVLVFAVDC